MDTARLERRLRSAVEPHDLLCHPFYLAWTEGRLTRGDLRAYAAQYRHQIDALPGLLRTARAATADPRTRAALGRNLDDEEGRAGTPAHRELWLRFAEGLGESRGAVLAEAPAPETREAASALQALVDEGEVAALAALWAYEMQTARVAETKRVGLVERYGVTEPEALSFFTAHEGLDVHHAADLLAAVARCCEAAGGEGQDETLVEAACDAAARSARAQWRFLDGPLAGLAS
jgi:pyrroloquinoline-quinone synthase